MEEITSYIFPAIVALIMIISAVSAASKAKKGAEAARKSQQNKGSDEVFSDFSEPNTVQRPAPAPQTRRPQPVETEEERMRRARAEQQAKARQAEQKKSGQKPKRNPQTHVHAGTAEHAFGEMGTENYAGEGCPEHYNLRFITEELNARSDTEVSEDVAYLRSVIVLGEIINEPKYKEY